MTARASMAELIGRVRLLIGDPASASAVFSDAEVQAALDRYRTWVRYAPLQAEVSYAPGGAAQFREYYAGETDWEADEQLVSGNYTVLAPATADRLTGRWTFAADQPPPVLLLGRRYDVFGAAADLLEAWASRLKLAFDFNVDGQSFERSQQVEALRALAADYRQRQGPAMVVLVRGDVAGN